MTEDTCVYSTTKWEKEAPEKKEKTNLEETKMENKLSPEELRNVEYINKYREAHEAYLRRDWDTLKKLLNSADYEELRIRDQVLCEEESEDDHRMLFDRVERARSLVPVFAVDLVMYGPDEFLSKRDKEILSRIE